MMAKVFISGSFDPLHSGHVAFFEQAASYGDLYVGIGSDASVTRYKHEVFMPQEERLYMVKAVKYVKDANINTGMGSVDFADNPFFQQCDFLIVNEDQASESKHILCNNYGKGYIVLQREPSGGLPRRTSTELREHGGFDS